MWKRTERGQILRVKSHILQEAIPMFNFKLLQFVFFFIFRNDSQKALVNQACDT